MNPTLQMVLSVLMRWVHVTTVVCLIGGVFYARLAGPPLARKFGSAIPWLAGALFLSGLYNFLTKSSYPPGYHMWFGIKFLIALHPLSMLVLMARPNMDEAKRQRWLTSILVSGLIVIAISGILRWLSLNPTVKLP